ncbi:MAG: SDR family oxidoreductase [Chromatiales bacterium]|nr:SDR family oxidoreductase [Chromatiales bacterium]
MLDLSGKKILITGASSGIGRACAIACARQGATLAMLGRNAERLAETRSRCDNAQMHYTATVDLIDYDQVPDVVAACHESIGDFHGLVNAAGVSMTLPLSSLRPEQTNRLFETNVTAGMNLTRLVVDRRRWAADGGSVVFVASVMGMVGEKGKTAYALTKGALLGGTRAIALELAGRSIRVNSVSPGVVKTPLSDAAVYSQSEASRQRIADLHPLGLGRPEDVADAVVFLLADESRWITGTNLVIDGGYTAR